MALPALTLPTTGRAAQPPAPSPRRWQAPVYGLGAFHCAEIPYEFYLPEPQNPLSCSVEGAVCYAYSCCDTDADQHLASEFLTYLANLAGSGGPNTGVAPGVAWPAWTPGSERFISLGDPVDRSATISAGARMLGAQVGPGHAAARMNVPPGRAPVGGGGVRVAVA